MVQNQSIIDEILKKVDIVDVIKEYLPGLKKAGRNYKALCPFHSEKTPSFTVNQEKQLFYCFGCGEGGNVFNFVMKIENLTFPEALKKLALRVGLHIDEKQVGAITAQDKEKIELKKIMEEANYFFQKYLNSSSGKEALEYLKLRNLKAETLRKFSIGLSPDSNDALISELKKKGYSRELILKSGLAKIKEDGKIVDYFRNRIMFPIRDYNGDFIAFGARALNDENPKYLNSQETPLFSKRRVLYGLYEAIESIRKEKKILLVEGYMDVIILHQYGINFAVSSLGTSFSYEQAQNIKRYCNEAYILFDPDNPGISAAIKAAEIMVEKKIYPRICSINSQKDPDEFIIDEGVDEFLSLLKNSKDVLDFKISLVKNKKAEIKTYEKAKIISYLLSTVIKQDDEIIKNEWLKKISENFKVSETILLNYMKKDKTKIEEQELKINMPDDQIPKLEMGFIHLLLKEPKLVKNISDFKIEFLQSEFAKLVFNYLKDSYENFKIEEICTNYPKYASLALRLYMEDIDSNINPSVNILKTAEMIKDVFYNKRWKYLKENLSNLTPEELKEFSELTKIIKLKNNGGLI